MVMLVAVAFWYCAMGLPSSPRMGSMVRAEGFSGFEVDNGSWVAGIDAECKVLAAYQGVDAGEAIAHGEFGVAE